MYTIINDLNIPSTLMVLHALLLENIINADVCAGYALNRALVNLHVYNCLLFTVRK